MKQDESIELIECSKTLGRFTKVLIRIAKTLHPFYSSFPHPQKVQPTRFNWRTYRRFIAVYNPFAIKGDRLGRRCPIRFYFLTVFWLFAVVRACMAAIIQLLFDKKFASWHNRVVSQLNKTDSCALEWQISVIGREGLAELRRYVELLDLLGSPHTTLSDVFTLGFLAMLLLFILIHFFSWNLSEQLLFQNSMTFFYSPTVELYRIASVKKDVINSMVSQLNRDVKMQTQLDTFMSPDHYLDLRRISDIMEIINLVDHRLKSPCSCDQKEFYKNRAKFSVLLRSQNIAQFVKPKILTQESYRKMINGQIYTGSICILIAFALIFAALWSFCYGEASRRAQQRIGDMRCKFIDPNSSLLRKSPMLDPLTDQKDLDNYSRYFNSTLTFEGLLLETEIPNILTSTFVRFYACAVVTYGCLGFAIGFFFLWIYDGYYRTSIWNQQILRQLKLCCRLSDEYLIMNHDQSHEWQEIIARYQLENALTITYINFMLFRRDYKTYQTFLQLWSNAVGYFILMISIVTYVIWSHIGHQFSVQMGFILVMIVTTLNLMGIICGTLVNNINMVFSLIGKIMARSSLNGMETSYIVTLWRRQVLTKLDVQELFGVEIRGIGMTYSNMIQLNSYVLGVLLFTMR